MAKCKYCLLHIPTGILIPELYFFKKSQGVAFLNSLPVMDGFFNPPDNPGGELLLSLTKNARKTYLTQVSHIINNFVILDKALHPRSKDDGSLFNAYNWGNRHKDMAKYSPSEFEVVAIKESSLPKKVSEPFTGVHLD